MDDAVARAFEGKRVFVTGHTGFKGSWLCEWLLLLGAEVWGYSLPPPTTPALFDLLKLSSRLHHQEGDVRNRGALAAAVGACRPDFVFHLAAQSLVRVSYADPVETCAVNILGTVHLLAALQTLGERCAAIIVTSDKCYDNREDGRAHAETDPLGGKDPYSASKAAAEIVAGAWRESFFAPARIATGAAPPIGIATVRAGNVIGGGDWARDRIMPDCLRALEEQRPILVRNPSAIRPWQHVLEPLSGYLQLAAKIYFALEQNSGRLPQLCSTFNFGPDHSGRCSVRELVQEVLKHRTGSWRDVSDPQALPEAKGLDLSIEKARRVLLWTPRLSLADAVALTFAWHADSAAAPARSQRQIRAYIGSAVAN